LQRLSIYLVYPTCSSRTREFLSELGDSLAPFLIRFVHAVFRAGALIVELDMQETDKLPELLVERRGQFLEQFPQRVSSVTRNGIAA
jgi:hypothetical protein